MPLPLAIMIPFMAGQSFAMGEAFGKGFQYGKRRVSSMTNEEFNKSSGASMFKETTADIKQMIPSMKNSMHDFSLLQTDIIKELITYVGQLPKEVLPTIAESVGNIDYLEIIKSITQAGGNASEDLIKQLIGAFKIQTASASTPPPGQHFPSNTPAEIIKIMEESKAGFIGPPVPPGGIIPPKDKIFDEDTRVPVGMAGSLRAPSSVITQFNKYNAEIKALNSMIAGWNVGLKGGKLHLASTIRDANVQKRKVNSLMLGLWSKYDLVGKVNTSYYSGPTLHS